VFYRSAKFFTTKNSNSKTKVFYFRIIIKGYVTVMIGRNSIVKNTKNFLNIMHFIISSECTVSSECTF